MIEKKIQLVVGLWLIASPWLLGFYDISLAKWNAVLIGIIIVLFGVWEIFVKHDKEGIIK